MNITLPPGSTSADLQAAVENAASGDTIIISGDMPFTDTAMVTIPEGKEITIQSDTGNNWTLSKTFSSGRHFSVRGSLILQDITLDGGNIGGGIYGFQSGTITINSDAVIKNCYAYEGGGVYTSGAFTMNGGSIHKNKTDSLGGGVFINGTFIMNGGSIRENKTSYGGGVYIIRGSGSMSGGSVSNNTADEGAGGIWGGPFTLSGGEISGNRALVAGGIYAYPELNITGGKIINNTAEYYAGGVYYATVNMTGGEISGNKAASSYYIGLGGGGVVSAEFNMSGGTLSGNTAINGNGGGVLVLPGTVFNMSDGVIIDNESVNGNGGGVYVMDDWPDDGARLLDVSSISENGSDLLHRLSIDGNVDGVYSRKNEPANVSLSGYFTNNKALNGNGGAIYTEDMTYGNITTGADTVFGCNRASAAHQPPADAKTLYPDIQFTSTTITDHPLNNYDIGYTVGEPIDVNFHVTYNANGGGGSYIGPGISPCETDTVLSPNQTGISHPGYTFTGWNTEPDGSGSEYSPADIIILNGDTTLYAQWVAERFTITYGANGGSGSFEDSGRQFGDNYMILSPSQTKISRPGFAFIGWNTQADGSGTSFAPGDIVTITGDVRLYAQWRQNPTPKPRKMCREPVIKCRKNIAGQKIWDDNDNINNTRPDDIEILLLRDEEVYKRALVNSGTDWAFGFCCLPVMKNSSHKYDYQIDETNVPGYTKKIEGYNVINTLNP